MPGIYSEGLAGFTVDVLDDETVSYTRVHVDMTKEPKPHKAKIKYTAAGRPYFTAFTGKRVHLDECLRV